MKKMNETVTALKGWLTKNILSKVQFARLRIARPKLPKLPPLRWSAPRVIFTILVAAVAGIAVGNIGGQYQVMAFAIAAVLGVAAIFVHDFYMVDEKIMQRPASHAKPLPLVKQAPPVATKMGQSTPRMVASRQPQAAKA